LFRQEGKKCRISEAAENVDGIAKLRLGFRPAVGRQTQIRVYLSSLSNNIAGFMVLGAKELGGEGFFCCFLCYGQLTYAKVVRFYAV